MMLRISVVFLVAVVALLAMHSADAGFPNMMSYQARLVDSGGQPLDGTYDMQFSLYDRNVGGELLWSEVQNVFVVNGVLDVLLGLDRGIDDTAFDAPQVWLEVHVPEVPYTFSRVRVMASAYAFRVQSLEGSRGGTVSGATTFDGLVTMSGPSLDVEGDLNLPDDIQLVSNAGTLSIISGASTITIAPGGAITINGNANVSITAVGNLDLEAYDVNITASRDLRVEAGVNGTFVSGNTTYVQGSLVEIN